MSVLLSSISGNSRILTAPRRLGRANGLIGVDSTDVSIAGSLSFPLAYIPGTP
jgi:hypothetical protein